MSTAIQAALAGEYAAIYAYGRAGGRLTADQDVALLHLSVHRTVRDTLRQWLLDDDEQPAPPAAAYTLPGPVNSDRQARELLALVELRLIPLYTELIAEQSEDPQRRRRAVREVRDCALRAQSWGAPGQAFPWPTDLAAPSAPS
ncbi:MAG TPA: ferritin-like domain-containing protein [Actinomycetota bacterium]|nr:ferritin-like domain-containing protein [Actinomycetota bacterium]